MCWGGGVDLPLSALIHLSLSHPAVAPVLTHCHAGAVSVLQTVALTLIILILHKADQTDSLECNLSVYYHFLPLQFELD